MPECAHEMLLFLVKFCDLDLTELIILTKQWKEGCNVFLIDLA